MFYVQVLINGLLLGGIFACVALGFSIIWGVLNVINIAHGSLIMIAAFESFYLHQWLGIDPFVSIPICMVTMFVFGYLVQRLLINQVIRAPMLMTLLLTFGLQILFINIGLYVFSPDFRMVTTPYSGASVTIGPLLVPYVGLGAFVVAVVITALLGLFMAKTKMGTAIRAVGMDVEAARLMGVNIATIYAVTYGVGASIAGAAGALVSAIYSISPNATAESYLLTGFVICTLGGLGSVPGAFLGALLYGIIQNFAVAFVGPGYEEVAAFVVLIVVLIVRPTGLFGNPRAIASIH